MGWKYIREPKSLHYHAIQWHKLTRTHTQWHAPRAFHVRSNHIQHTITNLHRIEFKAPNWSLFRWLYPCWWQCLSAAAVDAASYSLKRVAQTLYMARDIHAFRQNRIITKMIIWIHSLHMNLQHNNRCNLALVLCISTAIYMYTHENKWDYFSISLI